MAPDPYIHQDFPKMVYQADGTARVVATRADLDALGPGWRESPADHVPPLGRPTEEPGAITAEPEPERVPPPRPRFRRTDR